MSNFISNLSHQSIIHVCIQLGLCDYCYKYATCSSKQYDPIVVLLAKPCSNLTIWCQL